jgi:cytidine deaminase
MAEAEKARRQAYAPFSNFRVGAALLTRSGKVVHGCNVENSSYGLACCAERTAIFKAVSEGEREFTAIAVTAGAERSGSAPCGACRQVMFEFAPEMPVYYRDRQGVIRKRKVSALLPDGFRLRVKKGAR